MVRQILPISAVVCTLNSEKSIRECLASLFSSGLKEVIVVDGGSSDNTLKIVSEFECILLHDNGVGLGAARNLGISIATQPYLLNCGSDNVLNKELLSKMISQLGEDSKIIAIGCKTRVQGNDFTSRMLNLQWEGRIRPGKENVLGTPNIFRTSLIQEFRYSKERAFSDDEDLCTRIKDKHVGEFIVIPEYCLEIGQSDLKTLRKRFDYYGKSDFEIYSAYSAEWGVGRKIRSYLHPLRAELIDIGNNLPKQKFLVAIPFLLWATVLRYRGWGRSYFRSLSTKHKTKNESF